MSENLIKTDENGVRHCTQCPNQCPEDALRCGRGRKLFGTESGESKEDRGEGRGEESGRPVRMSTEMATAMAAAMIMTTMGTATAGITTKSRIAEQKKKCSWEIPCGATWLHFFCVRQTDLAKERLSPPGTACSGPSRQRSSLPPPPRAPQSLRRSPHHRRRRRRASWSRRGHRPSDFPCR